MKNITLLKRGS